MSDEIKKTALTILAEPITNSAKNITNKPTQNMGTTFADIWYLVFGGISQAAEKRKLKYSYALQEFENELKEKISKIPEEKLVEPDMQIIAPALNAAKYCIEKEELRKLFSNMIEASLNNNRAKYVHPIFANIINQLTAIDTHLLNIIYKENHIHLIFSKNKTILATSLNTLDILGLIYTNQKESHFTVQQLINTVNSETEACSITSLEHNTNPSLFYIKLTPLGSSFCEICLSEDFLLQDSTDFFAKLGAM